MNRWVSQYGGRYLYVNQFIQMCNELKVDTNKKELEHFHKIGLLYPVLQLKFPDEYTELFFPEKELNTSHPEFVRRYGDNLPPAEWEEIDRLSQLLRFPFWATRKMLFHPFDKKMILNKNYITIPLQAEYKPWDSYRIEVEDEHGKMTPSTINLFYSYWQVYQLEAIKRNPSWSKYWDLLQKIPADERKWYFIQPPKENGDFLGKNQLFDCFSFYLFSRINQYTIVIDQIKKDSKNVITATKNEWLKSRYKKLAEISLKRFSESLSEMEKFLNYFIENIYRSLEAGEKKSFLAMCKRDLSYLSEMMMVLTGRNFDELKNDQKFNRLRRIFRNDWDDKTKHLIRYFQTISTDYNQIVPSKYQINETEISNLVNFLSEEITFWGIIESIHSINKNFRTGDLVSISQVKDSLAKLCQYFEPFLRGLYQKRKRRFYKKFSIKWPKGCITNFFIKDKKLNDILVDNWGNMTSFDEEDPYESFEMQLIKIDGIDKNKFRDNIAAKIFLTILVRNFLSHRAELYFDEIRYREQLVEHVFAPLHSMFFAWIYNKCNYKLK